jgi:hypothetical protein
VDSWVESFVVEQQQRFGGNYRQVGCHMDRLVDIADLLKD